MCATFILSLLLLAISHCNAANILAITPFPTLSHTIPFVPLFQSLSTRHNITVITSNPKSIHPNSNVVTIDVSEVYDHELSTEFIEMLAGYSIGKHHEVFRVVVQNPDVRELILGENHHFDLVLADITSPIWTVFGHRFACPVIGLLPHDLFLVHLKLGNPTNPAVHSDSPVGLSYDMNTFEKIYNILIGLLLMSNNFFYTQQKVDYYLEEYFPRVPNLDLKSTAMSQDIAMLFVNQIPGFHKLRATTDTTKYIGSGPKYVEKFGDTINKDFSAMNKKIVVYIELDDQSHEKLMNALQNLDEDILWVKHPKFTPQQSQNNIQVIEAYEFQDILHQQEYPIDLLITNGDNHLIEVSLQHKIPMLVVPRPSNGQEMQNAQKLSNDNLAQVLHLSDIDNIQGHVEDMILHADDNREFLANHSIRMRTPLSGLQSATIWLEWLLETGNASSIEAIQSPTIYMNYIEAWYFDIAGTVILTIFIGLSIFLFLGSKWIEFITRTAAKKELVY